MRWSNAPKTRPQPITRSQDVDAIKLEAGRARRRAPTHSEKLAWSIARNRGLLGLKFRREQMVAGFCMDLYCAQLRACVEIDGGVHDDPAQRERDAERARALESLGIRVLRIAADRVSRDALEALLQPLLTNSGSAGE